MDSTSLKSTGTVLGRKTLTGLLVALALCLAGCSMPTSVDGAAPTGTAGGGTSAAPKAASCTASGSSIPDGHYTGPITATIITTLTISADGISIPNAGGGTESWKGSIDLVSSGGRVSGTISMSELGLSQVGKDGIVVHTVENGDLTGTITGTSASPTVAATGTGEWASLDAPVLNGSGSDTSSLTGGLHLTRADCSSITGDAVGMFADFMAPVAQYLAVSGNGAWTAARK